MPDTSFQTMPNLVMPNLVYLSLGSNVGDREAHLQEARARLGAIGRVVAISSFYETEPVEFTQQPWFLNCALALETSKTPQQLIAAILHIEEDMGRRRVQKKGPRSIDIDILLFDGMVVESREIDSTDLTIPHPALHQRHFVLAPLAEIASEVFHPVLKKTVRELLEALPAGQVVRKLKPAPPISWMPTDKPSK
ncbi:MAG: 2-amino-4-hydroxy-6-hydroxymethyldihydropteridine diphosphokinase [Candidatus Sulfotelmatobacter sp.]|jgi:2-amino-4-hydroxy-6-hydroxymethyldihydropteridine diphosphokinase